MFVIAYPDAAHKAESGFLVISFSVFIGCPVIFRLKLPVGWIERLSQQASKLHVFIMCEVYHIKMQMRSGRLQSGSHQERHPAEDNY